MAVDQSLNKPAKQVIVDLINRSLIKQFDHRSVHLQLTAGTFTDSQAFQLVGLDLPSNPGNRTRVPSSLTITIDGYHNSLFCNYGRLRLADYQPEAFVVGDLTLTDTEFLQQLTDRYGIYLDPAEVSILKFQSPVADIGNGFYYQWKVKPQSNHLVWCGDWYVNLYAADHPAVAISQSRLGDIDPFDVTGISSTIPVFDMPGLDIRDIAPLDPYCGLRLSDDE